MKKKVRSRSKNNNGSKVKSLPGSSSTSSDVSNRAILIVLLLLVVVSIISLVIYLDLLTKASAQSRMLQSSANQPLRSDGEVSLTILPPEVPDGDDNGGTVR